eukprot:TRINITY_DN16743_c0_g1_i1.p1 TRINITY_DN16743_c0_g1~~TRINITY_DN16743_c0_g1_i1.p1  ORF type:complete len:683 (+),score=220.63 TRINITY_DN16743_c0_g1_i1:120-2168(+)
MSSTPSPPQNRQHVATATVLALSGIFVWLLGLSQKKKGAADAKVHAAALVAIADSGPAVTPQLAPMPPPRAPPPPLGPPPAPAGPPPAPAPGRWWWLEWHMGHLRKQGRPVRAVVLGGQLAASDAAALHAFFAPAGLELFANAEPGAKATALGSDCSSTQGLLGIAMQLDPTRADAVIDLGLSSDPSEQVRSWRHCFKGLLRPGGLWVAEQAGKAYGDPGAPLNANRSMIALGRLAVDQINRRAWDPLKDTVLYPGAQYVQTVFFAENLVIFSLKGLWDDQSWDSMVFYLGPAARDAAPRRVLRDVDGITGTHDQPPTYSYHAGGTTWEGKYANPACAADEPGFGKVHAACAEAAAEVQAAAAAGQGMQEIPQLGAPYSKPVMDFMSNSDKLGGSTPHRRGTVHGYDRWYQWYFDPLRHRKQLRFTEVGLSTGQSSILWRSYFADVDLYGMDYMLEIFANATVQKKGGITLFSGDQGNPAHLRRMIKQFGELSMDVIIDDGGHIPTGQLNTFKMLFRDLLRPGGIFSVEDLEGSYMGRHGMYGVKLYGGLQKRGTFVEIAKLFVDTLNRAYWDPKREHCVLETGADAQIETIFFAENVVIFTKKGRPPSRPHPPDAATAPKPPPPPPRPAPQAEQPAEPMSGTTWDGTWHLPRPQCEATASGPGPDWNPPQPPRGRRTRHKR